MARKRKTSTSSEPVASVNWNVEWIERPFSWSFYVFFLAAIRWFLNVLPMSVPTAWTAWHIMHCAISFYLFHWTKGSPVSYDQGKYNKLTFWEQIDGGLQNTPNKKFLTLVPIIGFLIASHQIAWNFPLFMLNTACLIPVIVAKLPKMHGVRIFNINSE